MSIFIVIEGIDGGGKSTLVQSLSQKYHEKGVTVATFHEPTYLGEIGYKLKEMLKLKNISKKQNLQMIELYKEDRKWNLQERIKPSLVTKQITILDRYFFSTAAYQGETEKDIHNIINVYTQNPIFIMPTLLIYLDISPKEALQRMASKEKDKLFEKKSILDKVSKKYEVILSYYKGKHIRIDAHQPPELVLKEAYQSIQKQLHKEKKYKTTSYFKNGY